MAQRLPEAGDKRFNPLYFVDGMGTVPGNVGVRRRLENSVKVADFCVIQPLPQPPHYFFIFLIYSR